MTTSTPRLPKLVEADPACSDLMEGLASHTALLWSGSPLRVAIADLGPELNAALGDAWCCGHLVRGLEAAESHLAAEERGMRLADRQTGTMRGARVSRLLLLADDGAERFYRRVASLLRDHGNRVLAIRLRADADAVGAVVGEGSSARLLLLADKTAVAAVLLAIGAQWSRARADP